MRKEIIMLAASVLIIIGCLYLNSLMTKPGIMKTTYNQITKERTNIVLCYANKYDMNRHVYYINHPVYSRLMNQYYFNRTGKELNQTKLFNIQTN